MERIVVLDFGGQSNQLLVRRVRNLGVFSELIPCTASIDRIKGNALSGIILSGGPDDVNRPGAKACTNEIYELGVPILAICYGMQYTAKVFGGEVVRAEKAEYGHSDISYGDSELFDGVDGKVVWMSHTFSVGKLPEGFRSTASTANCPNAAMENAARGFYALQFHPEVTHTEQGMKILENFLKKICKCE